MVRNLFYALLLLLLAAPVVIAQKFQRCGTEQAMQQQMLADPDLAARRQQIQAFTEQFTQDPSNASGTRAVITIPVVVHVIYRTAQENISDAQIQSQINVLNQDFRRQNADATNTPAAFAGVAADCEIEFCLARRDPNGLASNGITRTETTVNQFGLNDQMKFDDQGGKNAWPRDRYLNIWVCRLTGGVLGYAYKPGAAANVDGVVIDFRYFGTIGTATAPFNRGRTCTHEIGHWLNLEHIWGSDSGGNCSSSDFVADTPNQFEETYQCPNFPQTDACSTNPPGIMFMNYMDYVNDNCMNIFTQGQKARMLAALNGPRQSIKTSNGCVPGIGSGGCDTLSNIAPNANLVLYRATQGGYLAGHNFFRDKAKAEFFASAPPAGQRITGAFMDFGVAKASTNAKTIVVKVWRNNGTGGSPGTVLAQKTVTIASLIPQVNAQQPSFIAFDSPVNVTTPYYIGIELTYAPGDTVALFTNLQNPSNTNTAWEQFENNSWFPFSATNSWNMPLSLAIRPVLCTTVGLEGINLFEGVQLYPNPNAGQFILDFGASFAGNLPVTLEIFNMQGKLVQAQHNLSSMAGPLPLQLNLSAGFYLLKLSSGGHVKTLRMIVQP